MGQQQTIIEHEQQIAELRAQLEEANDMIDAIRNGEIDTLIVKGEQGHQIYTLKSADQTYRLFIEKMNEGAITLNREGLILYANSRFALQVGGELSNVVGLNFIDFVVEAQRGRFRDAIKLAWDKEAKGEIDLLNASGVMVPFLFSLSALELDEGKAISLILADLTLQKENERKLRKANAELFSAKQVVDNLNNVLEERVTERTNELLLSREHFRFLADNIPVIAWKALPDGEMDYFNKRWYEFSGFVVGEAARPEAWLSIVHPDDRTATVHAWQNSIVNALPFHVEYRLKRSADAEYIWHLGSALPYRNDQDQVIAWFGISTDIDSQKKALEKKDEFINMVSHELKTPVTTLKGFTQLLMRSVQHDENPTTNAYLVTMNNQINKLTRLIGDLLDATKFSGGQLRINNEIFDFNTLVREVVSEIQLTTPHHHIDIELGQTAAVSGDKNRIGQVITNLLSNAIKYSPDSKRIIVRSAYIGQCLEFSVKDFGIGIPVAQQERLFTRFFRVSENNADTYPGLGLGLFISKGIMEKHGGTMWVKSDVGTGSEFYFSLPIANSSAA